MLSPLSRGERGANARYPSMQSLPLLPEDKFVCARARVFVSWHGTDCKSDVSYMEN